MKRQPFILPKSVKPIACKVPQGKVPISPTPQKFLVPHLKIQDNGQSKGAQPNADPRNSVKTFSSHGNVVLSNNLFSSTSKNLLNQAVYIGNNHIYLIPNNVGVPGNPVTPNAGQIQNKLMIPLKTHFSPKSHNSVQHSIFINSKRISGTQGLHLSRFVPIRPKSVPLTTPHLSTARESSIALSAYSINNSSSILPGINVAKTGTVRRKNGRAVGKSCKRSRKSLCSVVTTSQNVDPVDVCSDIQVKIERLDTSFDYRLTDDKKLDTPDSGKRRFETSSSKLDSCATGLSQNLHLGVDYDMSCDKAGMKVKTGKTEVGEERKQPVIMKKRLFRDFAVIHKEDCDEPFYDKEQENSSCDNIGISNMDLSIAVKSEMEQGNYANNANTELSCNEEQENSYNNTRIPYTGLSIAVKSEMVQGNDGNNANTELSCTEEQENTYNNNTRISYTGPEVRQRENVNDMNNSHPFQAVCVKSEPNDNYGESICSFKESAEEKLTYFDGQILVESEQNIPENDTVAATAYFYQPVAVKTEKVDPDYDRAMNNF